MIAKNLQDKMVPMIKAINSGERLHYTLKENEHLIFVFPVYAWTHVNNLRKIIITKHNHTIYH